MSRALKKAGKWVKEYDDTRLLHYESILRGNEFEQDVSMLDIYARMYHDIEDIRAYLALGDSRPYFLSEYSHAMGNGPGDLEDYMQLFLAEPRILGGCVWEWCDHAVYDGIGENGKARYLYGGKDRQIDTLAGKALPPGFINERVQTSDWEGKHTVGEFLYGSNWPETSMLLTYVEIPGVYIDLDRDISVCGGHVVAAVVEKEKGQIVLSLKNTTPYDAQVTVLAEHGKSGNKLGHLYYGRMEKILVPAREENVAVITVQASGTAST